MAYLAPLDSPSHRARKPESRLVVVSVVLLAGLALADRAAAWLVGEFPTSGLLWELRFEFLRPIGVYYDFAILNLGEISLSQFCGLVLAMSAVIVAGALSRVRLMRAMAYHLLCCLAVILWACSLEYRQGIYAPAGAPSTLYALIGAMLALLAATLCLSVHAEYLGWNPASSALARRARVALRAGRRRADAAIADLIDGLGVLSPKQAAALRIVERPRSTR